MEENHLSGFLPTTVGALDFLVHLSFNSNSLNGTIPTEIGNTLDLEVFVISDNQLTGNLPSELGQLNALTTLYCDKNDLNGTLPSSLANLQNLGKDTFSLQRCCCQQDLSLQLWFNTKLIISCCCYDNGRGGGSLPEFHFWYLRRSLLQP